VEGQTTKNVRPLKREVVFNTGATIPKFVKPFKVHIDANGFAINKILMQYTQLPLKIKGWRGAS
jgi:hypothetical protein